MKILVATSGCYDPAIDAGHSAFSFPWPRGCEIHVLSVAQANYPPMVGMVPDPVDTSDLQNPTVDEVRSIASTAALRFRELGYQAEGVSAKGDAETEILEHARTWGADLIVVGSHERTRLERFLVGSVSEHVVKHAACSVLILKHAEGV
ncbi:MAG TPA: universal stress protein [Bryobacteraceae bacterium]|jgi:nucleotide-binding universal stress UspA family protein|nr:universal stress protein [Bryobacteraceae bacterium]